jgi:cysteine desulfurase / selenocysteine lyase
MLRHEFPLLANEQVVYLDSAATTLKPRSVIDRIVRYYEYEGANVHRGVHRLSQTATRSYEGARDLIAGFINAPKRESIVFTSGITAGINTVAYCIEDRIKAGDEILITHMEHHSNIVPWQRLCQRTGANLKVVDINQDGYLDLDDFKKKLNPKVKVFAFVHISNALGTINPAKDLIHAAKSVGALTLVDAAQSGAHLKIDVQDLGCDFLALSGHKMYGPTGIGALYMHPSIQDELPPFLSGGDMIRSVSFEQTTYADAPARFEAGTPNIAGAIGFGAAVDFISTHELDAMAELEKDLYDYGKKVLSQIEGLRWIGSPADGANVFSFVLNGVHPHDLGTLVDEHNVAIRTGHHCCEPIMHFFKVPATARASIGVYNRRSDIDQLCNALQKAKEVFGA